MKVLLENLLRFEDGGFTVSVGDIQALADWQKNPVTGNEIQYRPARVLMQDFTGVPCVVDLAAMRDAIAKLGGDTSQDQPAGAGPPGDRPLGDGRRVRSPQGVREERRSWNTSATSSATTSSNGARRASPTSSAVPPGTGICHQVNLEHIAQCVWTRRRRSARSPIPTPASAPTATPRWSTASACSAGASAGSRPRRRCWASRSAC